MDSKTDKLKEAITKAFVAKEPPLKKLSREKGYGTFKGLEDIFKKQGGKK